MWYGGTLTCVSLFCFILGVLSQVVKNTRCISRANVVYMIPGTTDNLSSETFPALESFLIDLTNYFGIQKNGFNIGLMMYGKEPVVITELKPFKTQKQINTRVSLMSKRKQYANRLDGPENLSLAIQRMVKMFDLSTQKAPDFNFLLPVPTYNIAVLFVNGSKNFDQYALQAATEAKNRGIVIYVISYGKNGVDMLPLDLATDRCKAYTVDDYPVGLSNLVSKIGNSICEVTDRQLENVTRQDSSNNCNSLIVYEPPPLENNIVCRREEELFPDVHNCAYFYKCHLGIPTRLKCQVGDVFDSRTQTCNYKDAVSCYSQISCPRETGLFPYPGDCFKFLNCFRGISYVLTCPKGLMFDKVSKRCLRPGETFC